MTCIKILLYICKKLKLNKMNTKELNELKEQIQQDLLTYLDGIDEEVGNKEQEIITNVCKIVVNNFNGIDNTKKIIK